MKRYTISLGLCAVLAFAGCTAKPGPADTGVGDSSYVPSGAGGEGSGPTGTGGSAPADNPAGNLPGSNGTGDN
jgi:hypothetical protein